MGSKTQLACVRLPSEAKINKSCAMPFQLVYLLNMPLYLRRFSSGAFGIAVLYLVINR